MTYPAYRAYVSPAMPAQSVQSPVPVAGPNRFASIARTPSITPTRAGKHRLTPLTQALDLKDRAYLDANAEATPVHIRAALMRAWVDLQEIVMAIRGQGKPKLVEARNATPKRKRSETAPVVYPGPSDATPAQVVGERKAE